MSSTAASASVKAAAASDRLTVRSRTRPSPVMRWPTAVARTSTPGKTGSNGVVNVSLGAESGRADDHHGSRHRFAFDVAPEDEPGR